MLLEARDSRVRFSTVDRCNTAYTRYVYGTHTATRRRPAPRLTRHKYLRGGLSLLGGRALDPALAEAQLEGEGCRGTCGALRHVLGLGLGLGLGIGLGLGLGLGGGVTGRLDGGERALRDHLP